ncbi:MAG: HDOD domain-containing protein [Gammaproteobacteria bacterium]
MNAQMPTSDPQPHLLGLQHLPPLSPIAQRLLQEIARDDVAIPKLAAIIEQDPALAARLVGVANSAYFATKEKVYSVADAIIRVLGLKLVRSLAVGIALSSPFSVHGCRAFELDRYWYCSMQAAALAARLGSRVVAEPSVREVLFLAGLLHNLGQLALVHVYPVQMSQILQTVRTDPLANQEALECSVLGLDEHQAAVTIGHKWHLPYAILRIIEHQADSQYKGDHWQGAHLVGYCRTLANRCYDDPRSFDVIPSEPIPPSLTLEPDTIGAVLGELAARDEEMRTLARSLAV